MSNSIIIKVLKDYMETIISAIDLSDTDDCTYKHGLYDGTQNVLTLLESMLDVEDDIDIPIYVKGGING